MIYSFADNPVNVTVFVMFAVRLISSFWSPILTVYLPVRLLVIFTIMFPG